MPHKYSELAEVQGALERSVRSGPVRMEFGISVGPSGVASSAPLLYRPLLRAMEKRTKRLPDSRAVGFVDFARHRCLLASPGRPDEARLIVGGRRWVGHVDKLIDALPDKSDIGPQNPLWLVDILRGLGDVEARGEESVNGHACRRFWVHASLARAAAVAPYDMTVSDRNILWHDLDQIPVEVWVALGQGCIRRVRLAGERAALICTLNLLDFGVEVPPELLRLWTRTVLP